MQNHDYEFVKSLCESGATLGDIGHRLGLSRQRVHQLLSRNPELKELREYSKSAHTQWKQEEVLKSKSLAKYGGRTKEEFRKDTLRTEQEYRLRQKRANCKREGREFQVEWADIKWPTHCPILGLELDYYCSAGGRNENSVSFDRINPNDGYTKDNTRVVSWRANRIKNDGTAEEHRRIAEWMEYENDF